MTDNITDHGTILVPVFTVAGRCWADPRAPAWSRRYYRRAVLEDGPRADAAARAPRAGRPNFPAAAGAPTLRQP